MKEEVIVEDISDPDDEIKMVAVYTYDNSNKTIVENVEVCSKAQAYEFYNVIGELINGDLKIFEYDDMPEDDYDYDEWNEEWEDDE